VTRSPWVALADDAAEAEEAASKAYSEVAEAIRAELMVAETEKKRTSASSSARQESAVGASTSTLGALNGGDGRDGNEETPPAGFNWKVFTCCNGCKPACARPASCFVWEHAM
jgi:hypothetical protein